MNNFNDYQFSNLLLEDVEGNSNYLNDEEPKVDPFPVKVFPKEIQEIIESAYNCLNLPIDFFAASILYSTSIAIGNTYHVEIKSGWDESAAMWLALVGNSGVNKSRPLQLSLEPIFQKDYDEFSHFEKEQEEYNRWLQMTKEERGSIGKPFLDKPILKKHILNDYTPEALVYHHHKNLRGLGIYSDELAGWINNFNRYNKGNEEQLWLSAWSGKPLITDRKSSGSSMIKLPFVSVGGTIQTALLKDLAKGSKGKNGFVERLLFVFPDNLKKDPWSDLDWPLNQSIIYKQILEKLLLEEPKLEENGVVSPRILPLASNAKKFLWNWQANNTALINSTDSDQKKAIYAKLDIYAARFALILNRLFWATGRTERDEIDINSVTGGVYVAEYFRKNALKVLYCLNNSSLLDTLAKDKKTFYKALPEIFETAEAKKIAIGYNISQSTLKRLLADRRLFEKNSHGKYTKIY